MRSLLVIGVVLCAGVFGCASTPRAAAPDRLASITAYYEQATAPQRRAVRKPLRDQRAHALRMLAQKTDELLAETETLDQDARLVSLLDRERPAAELAVVDLRTSLAELSQAAANRDLSAVRQQYPLALAAYQRVDQHLGSED